MILTMKRHAARADSGFLQFKLRVPSDVAERVRGRVVTVELPGSSSEPACPVSFRLGEFAKVSLRTRDATTADTRRLIIIAALSKLYGAIRNGPTPLNQRQVTALSGEVYRHLIAEHGDNAGTPAEWETWKALLRAAAEGRIPGAPSIPVHGRTDERIVAELLFGENDLTETINALPADYDPTALRQRVGQLSLWVLGRHGIEVDSETNLRLMREIARSALEAGWRLKRMAGGDYRPDPVAERFPSFQDRSGGVTLTEIFDRWAKETDPAGSTLTTWKSILASFRVHLKHDDALRVRDVDVVSWKDSRVAAGRALKTVADSDLACLKSLFRYAVSNKLLSTSPAAGVSVTIKKVAGTSKLPYTDQEVARILEAAEDESLSYLRWTPLLLVTTGARVGEIMQLWGNRVREAEGVPALVIEPASDGGSLKNAGSERTVPLHPALIEAGFLDFVKRQGSGPLFYGSSKAGTGRHGSTGNRNRLSAWIRALPGFDDLRKPPAHAIRHWWKSTASRIEMSDTLADHIQGHAVASVAGRYRHFSMAQLAGAIAGMPIPTIRPEPNRDSGMPIPAAILHSQAK